MNQGNTKKSFFAKHAKSSAVLVSLGIHAIIIVVALSFVAVTVIQKKDAVFEAKSIKRPSMKLKKLQIPVNIQKKKIQKPKLRKTIVVKREVKAVDIKMPEIAGVKGGAGYMNDGGGLGSLGFDFDLDLFGSGRSTGNELAGTFYDLTKNNRGEGSGMTLQISQKLIERFLRAGWSQSNLERYYKAPTIKYANSLAFAPVSATRAPEAFGVKTAAHPMWLIHYKGRFAAPETGRYRFCGQGDDILYVRVKKRLVLDASWPGPHGAVCTWMSGWKSDDEKNLIYPLGNNRMAIGDWIKMEKGQPMEIEILIGETAGGQFGCQLLIEQKDQGYSQVPYAYGTVSGMRPVLPVFKTKEVPAQLAEKMKINPAQATLDGPTFGVLK